MMTKLETNKFFKKYYWGGIQNDGKLRQETIEFTEHV